MHLLIDTDSIAYAAGFVANEPGQETLACHQANESIKRQLQETQCDTYQLYLSGSNNFRYNIYPEYKANRIDFIRPRHLQVIREHLVGEWGATVTDGIEADDAVGIAQCLHLDVLSGNPFEHEETCISHIDKDINCIPGRHYNPTKKMFYNVSNQEAIRHFYFQLIMGDKTDNIPGYDGKMRPKVPQFLQPKVDILNGLDDPEDMLDFVSNMWGCYDEERWQQFNQAAHCLHIQRREFDDWRNYLSDNLMEEVGLPVGLIRSLPAPFEQPVDDGLLATQS